MRNVDIPFSKRCCISAIPLLVGLFASHQQIVAQESSTPTANRITRSYFTKFFLSYTPDGSHLSYSRHYDNRRQDNKVLLGMRIVKADGTDDRPLLPDFENSVQIQEYGSWSPDGKMLLLTGGGNDTGNASKDAFICEVEDGYKTSHLRKLIPGNGVNVGEQASWSPDGKEIVATTVGHVLWIFDADGKGKRKLVQTSGNYCFHPDWSPDGEWITFSSDRDGNPEIYKIRVDGTELTRLTESPGVDCRPKWSPDGQWLVFTSNRAGNEDLFLMRADGTGLRSLTEHPALDDHAAWLPNGRSIAFVSMRDGGFDIYTLPVPGDIIIAKAPPIRVKPVETQGDLIAHYDFDNDTGLLVRDLQSSRNSMQLTNARLVGEPGHKALLFNGKDSYANCGNGKVLHGSGSLTVSIWVRPDKIAGNGYVISKQGWNLYIGPDALPRFETRTGADNAWDTLASQKPVVVDKWTCVALVFDADKKVMQIYVDGKLAGSKERTDGKIGATASYPLELGCYVASRSQWYSGQLDDFRIYNRALKAEEVEREFSTQLAKVVGK